MYFLNLFLASVSILYPLKIYQNTYWPEMSEQSFSNQHYLIVHWQVKYFSPERLRKMFFVNFGNFKYKVSSVVMQKLIEALLWVGISYWMSDFH